MEDLPEVAFELLVEAEGSVGAGGGELGAEFLGGFDAGVDELRVIFESEVAAGAEVDHFAAFEGDPFAVELLVGDELVGGFELLSVVDRLGEGVDVI